MKLYNTTQYGSLGGRDLPLYKELMMEDYKALLYGRDIVAIFDKKDETLIIDASFFHKDYDSKVAFELFIKGCEIFWSPTIKLVDHSRFKHFQAI